MYDDAERPRTDWNAITLDRRTLLGGVVLSATVGLSGCMEIANWIADEALGDVNVFNETDSRMRGELVINGPDDSTVLSESFDLEAQTEDEPNSEAMISYEDVWEHAGEYHVDVHLDEDYAVRGQHSAESAVTLDAPDEQMLGIGLGVPDRENGIVTLVATEWSDFAES